MRIILLILILLPAMVQAEFIVYLVDGGKMVAKKVTKKGSRLVLTTQMGTVEISRSRVDHIAEDVAVSGEYPGKPGYGNRYGQNSKKAAPKKAPVKKLTPAEQNKLLAEINQKIEAKRRDIYSTNRDTPDNVRARKELEEYKRQLVQEYRAKGVELDYRQ